MKNKTPNTNFMRKVLDFWKSGYLSDQEALRKINRKYFFTIWGDYPKRKGARKTRERREDEGYGFLNWSPFGKENE